MASLIKNSIYCALNNGRSSLARLTVPSASIYTDRYLDLDIYQSSRQVAKARFGENIGNFMSQLKDASTSTKSSTIFSDDIKNYLYLVDNETDSFLKDIFAKYSSLNLADYNGFRFGPLVMRALLHVKNPRLGLDLMKDEKISPSFQDVTTYHLLLTLLYRSELYEEVLQLYDMFCKNREAMKKPEGYVPNKLIYPVAAACYKLNSPKSFEKLTEILKVVTQHHSDFKNITMKRFLHFYAALALKQNQGLKAIESLAVLKLSRYYVTVNLRIRSLASIGRPQDALSMLQDILSREGTTRTTLQQETLDSLNEAVHDTSKYLKS